MAGGKIDILVEPDVKGFGPKLESGLGGALGTATKIGAAFGVALGFGELARQVTTVGMDFQSQMNTMAAVSQATGAQLDAVAQRARDLGNDTSLTATSASDAAAAMTELAKGGFTVEQSMEAAKGTLQLAAAAQVDAATAATIQSQALQAFSLDASEASRVSDILAGAANASSAEIGDVAAALQQSGTVAQQFGVSIDDTATAIAMFANAGITGSDAGTLLKSALLALTDQGKPAQAAIEELGLTVYDAQGKFVGMESLMGQLNKAAGEMTDEQYQAATATLFGSDAMRLAGIAASQGAPEFDKLRDAVTRQGQAAEVAAAQTEGLPGAMERLQNASEEAFLGIFDAVDESLVKGADLGVAAIEKIGPAAAGAATVAIDSMTAIGSAISPVVELTANFASGLDGLVGPIGGVAAALAVNHFTGFSKKMDAGTGSLIGFGQQMGLQKELAKGTGREIGTMSALVATMETRSVGVAKLTTAFREAGEPAIILGRNTKRAAQELGGLDSITGTAKGNLQIFGGVAQGVANGGLSALKTGASNLVGFLGGPWGVAFTVAGLAIGHLVQKHQEAAQAEAEHKAAQEALAGTLDATTGAVTEQTRALQEKTLQESGAIDTARNLGIASSTVVDAAMGNAAAQREVAAAVDAANIRAVEYSDTWKKNGQTFLDAGLSAADLAAAMDGNQDAIRRVNEAAGEYENSFGPGLMAQFNGLKSEVADNTESFSGLKDEVIGAADTLDEVQTQKAQSELLALQEQVRETKGVLDVLGDTVYKIEDSKTISVEASAVTDETRAKLEEIGVTVGEPMNGRVDIEFPDGANVLMLLEEIGMGLSQLDGGYIEVNAEDIDAAKAALEELGLKTTTLDSGEVVIDTNAPEVLERLIELGLAQKDHEGKVTIDWESITGAEARMDSLRQNAEAGAKGKVEMSDNSVDTWNNVRRNLDGKVTYGRHVVTTENRTIMVESSRSSGGRGFTTPYADGALRTAATGWLSDQQAQIAPGGSWLLWAEDETEGESFIPHSMAKRHRSKQILAETASIFGLGLIDAGGNQVRRDGTSVAPTGQRFADGAVRTGSEIDAFSRDLEGKPYVWGGVQWGDCSGAMSAIARFATGLEPFAGRFATGNQREALQSMGFQMGMGPEGSLRFGWFNGGPYGGHTSGTLPSGVNVEMGGARGNGQYGGGAAGFNDPQYTDHAWIPVGGGGSMDAFTSGVASTSAHSLTLKNGESVEWGKANDLYEQAVKYLRKPQLFDTGGILPTGGLAYNAGPPERVLSAQQTRSFDQALVTLPRSAADFQDAARIMLQAANSQIEVGRQRVQDEGRYLGGDWVGQAQIVQDAEQGLVELRKQVVVEVENISIAERNLTTARKELSEAQEEGAALSTSTQRKLEDAEAAVAKARESGKADKIADAEKKLARAREDADKELAESADDNAENVRKAMDKVAKAEESLTEVQDANADAAIRLEAAERAIAAARYQALADMATGVGAAFQAGLGSISGFFDEMARLASIVDETRQSVSRLQMQQVTNHIQLLKAQQDVQVKEWDLQRARARGAMSVAQAEAELDIARQQAALMGSTSIEAMSGAMDRFRVTGIFSVSEVAASVVANSAEVKAAEWGVAIARAQAALDQQLATHEQAIAQFSVVEATLTQHAAVEMLRLQTDQLTKQTEHLYGLTPNAATGASKGIGGIGQALGGAGQVIGGILTGLAGFAVGGPLGAIPGAMMAIKGLGGVAKGGIDAWTNKDDVKDAWGKMGTGEKIAIVGGGLLGGAATVGGAYLGGPEGAQLGAELGAAIIDTTVGSLQHSISAKIDKINRDSADAQQSLTLDIEAKRQALEAQRLQWEQQSLAKQDALMSELEYAKLQQLLVKADTKGEAQAIAEAARIEAERMGHMITIADGQSQELVAINGRLAELVSLTSDQAAKHGTGVTTLAFTLPPGEAFSRDQVQAMFQQAAESLDLRLRELESASEVTADDYYTARVY